MAISDGIGGSSVGSVLTPYAAALTVTSASTDGTTVTVLLSSTTGLKKGQYVVFDGTTFTFGGVSAKGIPYQITDVVTNTSFTFKAGFLESTAVDTDITATPYQNAFGLVNTRQAQIQGIEKDFSPTLGTLPDDSWHETTGLGLGAVPNNQPGVPGGMNAPTLPYSVRRYMINFALGLFTQDKLIPTKWMASQLAIEITLELAENCIYQPVGFPNTTNPTYMVGNVALIPEIIEFDDVYDNNFLSALESGGVPIKFSTWNYYQFNTQSSSTLQLAITERSRSVKGLLAVQRRAQGGFQYDSHACVFDSSPLTNSAIGTSMKQFQYRIGGRYFPGQPVELSLTGSTQSNGGAEAYSELAKFLNIVGDARLSTNMIPINWAVQAVTHRAENLLPEYDYSYSSAGFRSSGQPLLVKTESSFSAFCGNVPSCMFTCATNFETSNGLEISGLNAEEQSDISFNVSWTSSQSGSHQIEIFTYCDRMMVLKVYFYFNYSQTIMLILFNKLIKYGIYNEMGDNYGLNNNYEYKEFSLDSLDADSSFITSAASTDWPRFTVAADGPLENVVAIKVLEAEISFSWDVFNSVNNSFTITESVGGTKTITIPVGNYTGAAIATALTTAFVTAGTTATYTVTYSGLRNRLVFTSSTNNTFLLSFGAGYNIPGVQPNSGNTNPRLFIGFPPGDTSSTSVGGVQVITSPNTLLLSGPNYLYLNSTKLGSDMDLYLPTGAFNLGGGKSGPQIAKIPVNCNANNLITWKDPDPQKWFKFRQMQSLSNFDFYLTLGNTTSQLPLQLNGLGFSLKLGILKELLTNSDRVLPTAQNGRVSSREGPKRVRPTY